MLSSMLKISRVAVFANHLTEKVSKQNQLLEFWRQNLFQSRISLLVHSFSCLPSSSYGRVFLIQVRHKKRMGTEGLSFYHPNLLCCLDQMLAVIELSQHLVSSSKTVRPIIHRSARCMGHVKIMWSAVCLLAPHSHFAEKATPHLCMDEPTRPTPVRRRLSLTQAVVVKLIPVGLVLTLGM